MSDSQTAEVTSPKDLNTGGKVEVEHSTKSSSAMNHLLELVGDVEVAMLTTQDQDGNLRSRPMQTIDASSDGTLWFFTSDHHGKASEIEADPRVNLSYGCPEKNRYISVSGLAEISHDLERKRELWDPSYRAWFPEGVDDSHCALLKVYIEKAEYWDASSSSLVQIVGFTKALLSRKPFRGDLGQHKKIAFDNYSEDSSSNL